MRIFFLAIFILNLSACGIKGVSNNHDLYVTDPDVKVQLINWMDNKPIAKELDSLLNKIDSAKEVIPNDLSHTTLIVQTFSYEDYLTIFKHKYNTPKDSKYNRKVFEKYSKNKESFFREPKFKILYANKDQFDSIDINSAKYILKLTNRLDYSPDKLQVKKDSSAIPWVATAVYYIFDRETHKVFREIKDWSLLDKKRK
jgi:hypothetical protein